MKTRTVAWALILSMFVLISCDTEALETQKQTQRRGVVGTDYQIEMATDIITEEPYFRVSIFAIYNTGSRALIEIKNIMPDTGAVGLVNAKNEALLYGYERSKLIMQNLLKNSTPPNAP